MANPLWPASLPANPFGADDPTYKPAENILRTSMQGGIDKLRPLFTAVPETITITLQLSPSGRAALRTFIKDTLGYVMPFTWIDFRTGATATYRYASKALPTEKYLGADETGTWWVATFDLELMP
ncbi:MAG: hypothetical protein ACTS5I_00720 [Rhodanobacter sp.]